MFGVRGAGKTVALNSMITPTQQQGWMLLHATLTTDKLINRINHAIRCARQRHDLEPWQQQAFWYLSNSWTLQQKLRFLSECAARYGAGVMLLVDSIYKARLNALRAFVNDVHDLSTKERLPLALVATSLASHRDRLFRHDAIPSSLGCNIFEMPMFSPCDVRQCITRTTEHGGGAIQPEALEFLVREAGTLPVRAQLLGHYAWKSAGAPDNVIGLEAAQQSVKLTATEMRRVMCEIVWSDLKRKHQDYLRALVQLGGSASSQEIQQQTGFSSQTVAGLEQHLLNVGCVQKDRADMAQLGEVISEELIADRSCYWRFRRAQTGKIRDNENKKIS